MSNAKESAALVERMVNASCTNCSGYTVGGECKNRFIAGELCRDRRVIFMTAALAAITETHRIEPMEATEEMEEAATKEAIAGLRRHDTTCDNTLNAALAAGDIAKG